MVQVQQHPLGALEQDVAAGVQGGVDLCHGVGDVRLQAVGVPEVLLEDRVGVHRQAAVDLGEEEVLLPEGNVQLRGEDLAVEEVLDPDADAGCLVGVGRPDPSPGGPQLHLAEAALRQAVELPVVGHDEVGIARDAELFGRDAPQGEGIDLLEQDRGVHDHARCQHRRDVRVQDAGGKQVQLEGLRAHDHGVAGVVAPLIPDNHVHGVGHQVGDLALPLVPPLRAQEGYARHVCPFESVSRADVGFGGGSAAGRVGR